MLNRQQKIGTAWYGKHVVIITCDVISDRVLQVNHSLHAPLEPVHFQCSEALGTYLSIGYKIANVVALSSFIVQYVLVK
jgi:hypothetical protein